MTLKYESEILFDLMKRDGDDTPSDVLPYESELKEKYLEQVEGAYPKLTDYRPEWLFYNLHCHLPADFPAETLSDVTEATVDNVVPYAYGSASLKGQTLVNIPTKNYSETAKEISAWVTSYDESFIIKPNTKYYIGIFNYSTESKVYGVRVNPFTVDQKVTIQPNGYGYLIATTVDSITSYALVVNKATHTQNNNAKFLFIEYQEGMENWDIPYFEGMQSAQMPGLTTSNEDGTKTNILTVNEEVELRGIGDVKDELNLLTGELTQRIGEVVLNGSEKWFGTSKNYRVEIPNVKGYKDLKWGQKSAMCSLYPPFEGTETDSYIISEWEGNQIRIHDVNSTLEELKAKLAKNPLHIIFLLNEESVKTVELTVTNQDGNSESVIRPLEGTMHLMTEGDVIKPLFSGEIPVEATTQNLMSFVNIEGEEK